MPVITKSDFINQISQKVMANELSLFLGAGVSSASGIPNWKELMAPLAMELHLDINLQSDYYQIAQYYVNTYGKPALKRHINNSLFLLHPCSPSLELLLKFQLKTIWTTNFDNLIEQILQKNFVRYQVLNNDAGLANVSTTDCVTIYKLNGDKNDLEHIVISMDDWEAYEENHPAMLTFLKKELISNTFLFYGYSFKDNLIKSCLYKTKKFMGDSGNVHYTIQKRQNENEAFKYFIDDLEQRYHVRTLLVDSYEEIPSIFEKIIEKTTQQNVFISGRLGDVPQSIEKKACEFSRELSIQLLKNGYNICTGMGRKIGYFVSGPAIQYLLEQGYPHMENRLKIRPFDDTMPDDQKRIYREKLIQTNHVAIFIYGHSSYNNRSRGVWEEYQIAKKLHKIIIPIGATGYESEAIWKDVKGNLTEYPYLETSIDDLQQTTEIPKLTNIVCKIIDLTNNG